MRKLHVWGGLPLSSVGLFGILLLVASPVRSLMAGSTTGQEVELRCKIMPPLAERRLDYWRIELDRSTGEPVMVTTALTGDTVRFKHLQPDIYVLCLDGAEERHSCQSLDLVPPRDNKDHSFLKKLMPPVFKASRVQHRVSVSRLEVPKPAHDELVLSEEAQMRGDGAAMFEHLNNAVRIWPDYSDALNNLGVYYRLVRNYPLSIQYFTRVTELQPDFYGGWLNLGSTLLGMSQFRQSLDASLKALALRPDDAMVNSQVACGYYYLREYDSARVYFERVLALDPSFANSPQLYLAHIALVANRDADAEDYYRQFLKLHPNSPQAPHYRETLAGLVSGAITHTPPSKRPEDK
jgi:Tfp pilus assembly protein PilF